MRNAWLAALVLFCGVSGGFILVQGRGGAEGGALISAFGDGAGTWAADEAEESAEAGDAAGSEPAARPAATFYRYTDDAGSVRFVTSLAEVPRHLRDGAVPVAKGRVQRAAPPRAAPPRRARMRAQAALPAYAAQREVVVYTTAWCGWCRKTLAFLDRKGVDYENRDIEANDDWREELEEKTGGTSIPVVEIDGQIVRGYDPARMAQLLQSS
jgi:glutaredoxin